jgi:hypothetical protein
MRHGADIGRSSKAGSRCGDRSRVFRFIIIQIADAHIAQNVTPGVTIDAADEHSRPVAPERPKVW